MRRLLIRPGAIGDFILSLPALNFLKTSYTELWCPCPNIPLAHFADRARSIASVGLDRVAVLPARDVFDRLGRFDEIHSWYGAARPDFREAVAHLPFLFYDALPPARTIHATDFYCRQVGAPLTLPILPITAFRRNFSVIHPFASSPAKRWPLERFREIAAALGNAAWCAGPEEPFDGAVRIADLYRLGEWLAEAQVFIGNDSGITHLAAAVGTPVVAIFGPTDPAVWAPRGPHVRTLYRDSIQSVRVADVLAAARSLI